MQVEIIDRPFALNLYGFSDIALNKDYAGKAFQLMDKMWRAVKENELKNKGINIWVYESNEKVFAGVELLNPPANAETIMEHKPVTLVKYAYYKHIGPYRLIKNAGQKMNEVLKEKGIVTCLPYIEIYGHWTNDENKLETELLFSIK